MVWRGATPFDLQGFRDVSDNESSDCHVAGQFFSLGQVFSMTGHQGRCHGSLLVVGKNGIKCSRKWALIFNTLFH